MLSIRYVNMRTRVYEFKSKHRQVIVRSIPRTDGVGDPLEFVASTWVRDENLRAHKCTARVSSSAQSLAWRDCSQVVLAGMSRRALAAMSIDYSLCCFLFHVLKLPRREAA